RRLDGARQEKAGGRNARPEKGWVMKRFLARALPSLLLVAAVAPFARAQVTVDDRVTSLAEHVKKKADDQAATVIEGLAQNYATMTEEDKKKALSAMEKCLN